MDNQPHPTVNWKEIFKPLNIIYNLAGIGFMTLALNGFMIPNKFLDGGVTGISIFIHEVFHIPFGLLTIVLNIPFIVLGKRLLGKTFAVQTIFTILVFSLCVSYFDVHPVTTDPLLIALFGGCLIGIGMGLCIRGGAAVDGAEILAVLTTRKVGLKTTEVIFAMNAILFLLAIYSFGISTALYSIVTYFAAIKSVDYVVDGFEQYTSLHIISRDSEAVKALIVKKFGKGITIMKGERGYLPESFDVKTDCDIVVTVVTRLELLRIKEAVRLIDPTAFMFIHNIKEASGGILSYKKAH